MFIKIEGNKKVKVASGMVLVDVENDLYINIHNISQIIFNAEKSSILIKKIDAEKHKRYIFDDNQENYQNIKEKIDNCSKA